MIWMGVGRPEDFVAPLNRFPVHNQRVTNASDEQFVTIFYGILVVIDVRGLLEF